MIYVKFKVVINGENNHRRVNFLIYTDLVEDVVKLRGYARKNKFQINVELIDI